MQLIPEIWLTSQDSAKLNLIRSKYVGKIISSQKYQVLFVSDSSSKHLVPINDYLDDRSFALVIRGYICWSAIAAPGDEEEGIALEILVGEKKFFIVSWDNFPHIFFRETNVDHS